MQASPLWSPVFSSLISKAFHVNTTDWTAEFHTFKRLKITIFLPCLLQNGCSITLKKQCYRMFKMRKHCHLEGIIKQLHASQTNLDEHWLHDICWFVFQSYLTQLL